ncbi:MAG: flavodoxin family protein [Tychonema bourrellyi B0820]|uniref:Flavodoxin family protein n=1 Tax=Tychonema bourrellyi FEM_GT703 TaxID=2040638 RepID=A0A2G4F409_9CYAN|nr:flavodoxin family protein [Tychonema bourrellyi]MDQ2096317.1 flavodoxin family protein [Tychonema bourrellyi B0820]PHX56478.1 flavodoxin family protein [Tychonema bourrellyi FEM_GT703]
MSNLAIVYFSGSGKTHLMAQAIAEGATQLLGVKVELLRIVKEQIVNGVWQDAEILEKLNQADAIVFGSPTYMGGVAGQFKLFIDAASEVWFRQEWKDKIAAGFTHSSCASGDKQGTLLYLAINASQHGMIWVNVGDLPSQFLEKDDGVNRLGSFLGVMGQGTDLSGVEAKLALDPGDRLTAFRFGKRIAEAAERWSQVK